MKSLAAVVRWVLLVLAVASLGYGLAALVLFDDPLWNPDLPWSGALPALLAAPIYWIGFVKARSRQMQPAALALLSALFVLSILASWPRGAFSTGWYMQPFLALLATCCLGVALGLSMTLLAVLVLLAAALAQPDHVIVDGVLPVLWAHSTSLSAVTLASALVGALIHKVLLAAVQAAENQRRHNIESSRALRYREKLLRHALRVETVGDLASMVVHQLRNTFQVLMAHTSLAVAGDDEERIRRLRTVSDTLREAQPLLDQLMVLAHPEDGTPTATDLVTLVSTFHEKAARVLPATMEVRLEPSEVSLPVVLDPRGFEHSLWNLVINARHAMGGQGTITLRTGVSGKSTWVAVEDTGPGIPSEIRGRIFDPYFTTKPPGEGTGLGLTAVARFVRGSNGSIEVHSAPGRGAEFMLIFPLTRRAGVASA